MTVGVTAPLIDYVENGVTTVHPIPFQFQGAEEIVCTRIAPNGARTPCVNGADYAVTGGDGGTGSLTKASAGVAGTVFRVQRYTTRAQLLDLHAHDNFPAEDVEVAFDRVAAVNQEQEIEVSDLEGRAVRVPVGETIAPLPAPADRKGTLFGFNILTGVRELLSYANIATILGPLLTPLLAAISKGDPGGNIMAIGLFLAGPTLNIPAGTDIVRSSGYSVTGKGGALYQYDVAIDAAYVAANPRTAFISANARGFRLSLDQQLNVMMFGAIGNDVANDGAAFVAALAFCFANAQSGTGFGDAAPSLFVPFAKYYLGAQPLDVTHTIDFFGEGSVGPAGGAASQLRWDDGTSGVRFQAADTAGDTATGPQGYPGSHGSRFRNFYLKGGYAGVESEHHAVLRRARVAIENVFADNFPGDGIATIAGADANGGNANGHRARRIFVRRCRDGMRMEGADTNAGSSMDLDLSDNRRWGGYDSSFLGNLWQGLTENNGKTPGAIPCYVSHGGNWYAVVAGQEVDAATNPPSGTVDDNDWWYYMNPGAPSAPNNIPAWFNGIVMRAGGSFRADDVNAANVLLDWYAEGGQGPLQLVSPTLVLGGLNLSVGVKGVSVLRCIEGALDVGNFHVRGNLVVGPTGFAGTADDINTFFDFKGTNHIIYLRKWTGPGTTVTLGAIQGHNPAGMYLIGNPGLGFFIGDPGTPTNIANITSDGIVVETVGAAAGFYMGALKVVGERQPPIGDALHAGAAPTMGDFNSLVDTVNLTLARIREHGLIHT